MTEYTPTTENILNCYVYSSEGYDGSLQIPERQSRAEFDRWLNEIRAEAWDECVNQMPIDLDWKNQYSDLNPYRANEK